jgi:hypothetical protein
MPWKRLEAARRNEAIIFDGTTTKRSAARAEDASIAFGRLRASHPITT